jgi:hypothetical protein
LLLLPRCETLLEGERPNGMVIWMTGRRRGGVAFGFAKKLRATLHPHPLVGLLPPAATGNRNFFLLMMNFKLMLLRRAIKKASLRLLR